MERRMENMQPFEEPAAIVSDYRQLLQEETLPGRYRHWLWIGPD